MINKYMAEQLRERLRGWTGDDYEVVVEVPTMSAIIWVIKLDGERVNHLPEYGVLRAFWMGDMASVSVDAANTSADEAFKTLGRVVE